MEEKMIFRLIKIFKVVDILYIIFAIITFFIYSIYNLIITKNDPLATIANSSMTLIYRLVEGIFYYLVVLFIEKWCKKNE
jgi:hypothetical protein